MEVTLSDGRTLRKVFEGEICTTADLQKFTEEVAQEIQAAQIPLVISAWAVVPTAKVKLNVA